MSKIMGKNSIWLPLLSTKKIIILLYASSGILALMVFLLPNEWPYQLLFAKDFIGQIKDVAHLASKSSFGMATSISYAASILLAACISILTCFCHLNTEPLRKLTADRNLGSRIIIFAIILLTLATPYTSLLSSSTEFQKSHRFMELVATQRFFLLLWVEGIFLGFYVLGLWLLIEATNFFRNLLKA